ncbi:D-alanyl-D-alanine carboxypeptidase [Spirillospora sp. NPDC047279]|uniref:D-alanyl-D-alanine carboxypeptidase family protein n=1 Tax=Spirillospora sp. NPDC047279 TaxID=3155478 RepID=UPI0033D0C605
MRSAAPTVETPGHRSPTPTPTPTPKPEWQMPAPPAQSSRDSGQWTVQSWSQDTEQRPDSAQRPYVQQQEFPQYQGYAQQEAEAAPQPYVEDAEAESPKRKKRRGWLIALVVVVLLAGGAVAGQLLRPLPKPTVALTLPAASHTFAGAKPSLAWPANGQSVIYVDGIGTMGAAGGSVPIPTASVAKVMTAYVFLKSHPLQSGEDGPTYTVSQQAAARLPAQKQRGESLLEVTAGQRLTERKALEALMIISANDVAHELARWDAGNPQAFVQKMNAAAQELGMTSTRYTDPSGYQSTTVSTAADQVKLLRAAMKIPAFAEIVNQRTFMPSDGGQPRTGGNILLGQLGVVGGKTGYTDAAGGNFIFAARKRVGSVSTLIVGAVMGQRSPSAMGAIDAAKNLVAGAEQALVATTLAPAGTKVAEVDDGLGGITPLNAKTPLTVVGWAGLTVPVKLKATAPHEAASGERLGTVSAGPAKAQLVLGTALDEPSITTRLTRLTD